MIEQGKKVPDLAGIAGKTGAQTLHDLHGQWVVVYFYPKDNTPGCTSEAGQFRDLHQQFRARNAVVIGVSRDSDESHRRFIDKLELPFPLVADTDETWCKAFDVIHEKNLYGRKYMGLVRSTFLIDPDGRLHAQWLKVRVRDHAQAVLDAIPG